MQISRESLLADGLELSEAEFARLDAFVMHLLAENQRQNLTGTRDAPTLWTAHVVDSVSVLPLIDQFRPQHVADVGTGGGLPGMPLACLCSDVQFTLIDSTRKKVDALSRMAAALGLNNVIPTWGRAEDLGHQPEYRELFDAVTSRAVGRLSTLLEYASGLLRPDGQAWLYRAAHSVDEEIEAARHGAGRCRMSLVDVMTYTLPDDHGRRAIMIYAKDRALPDSLPRGQGRPAKQPL